MRAHNAHEGEAVAHEVVAALADLLGDQAGHALLGDWAEKLRSNAGKCKKYWSVSQWSRRRLKLPSIGKCTTTGNIIHVIEQYVYARAHT